MLWRDQDYRKWREERRAASPGTDKAQPTERASEGLVQRVLESRAFIAAILAMAGGAFLFPTQPFPDQQIFLRVIAQRAPQAFLSFKYTLLRAPVHHAIPGLLDRAFGPLHLHAQSRAALSRRGASPVSRSPYERRPVSRRRRSAQPAQAGTRQRTHRGSRFPSAVCSRESRSWARLAAAKLVLHASVCRADSRLQSWRQRKADRRADT